MPDDQKRLTISDFERIAEENARAEREAGVEDDPTRARKLGLNSCGDPLHTGTRVTEGRRNRVSAESKDLGTLYCHIACPHCKAALSEREISSILGQFARNSTWAKEGPNRFKKITPEQRSEEARKASNARWSKRRDQGSLTDANSIAPETTVRGTSTG